VISKELLDILRCPEDRTPLTLADAELVARCNQAIAERRLKNKAGLAVERDFDGGLIRADAKILYPIIDDIPVLLIDEGIALSQLPQ
jgi:uncharacterized protein YbaR (Trm112 family)